MRLLVISPHPDDEILGTGGTIARCAASGVEVTVLTVAAHKPPLYPEAIHEQTIKEARKAHAVVGVAKSVFLDIPAVLVNQIPTHELNGKIMEVVEQSKPQAILCAYPDRHIDHRIIFDAAMVAGRPVGTGTNISLIAAYETLSETHWNAPHIEPNFTPNWVVDITDTIEKKVEALQCYESQVSPLPAPRSIEAVRALAMFRGSQNSMTYGEAFHVIRMTTPFERLLAI